jgi:two-component system chemotaxis response regulator CheY
MGESPKILTVEDSEFERMTIVKILKKNGYENVSEAENGERGLEKCVKDNPDLVLLDLRMPGMSGYDVLKELTAKHPAIKVIVVSILREQKNIKEALDNGAKAYITKPVKEEVLIKEIKNCLGG